MILSHTIHAHMPISENVSILLIYDDRTEKILYISALPSHKVLQSKVLSGRCNKYGVVESRAREVAI